MGSRDKNIGELQGQWEGNASFARPPIADRITKLPPYGDQQMPETQIKIGGGVREESEEFTRQQKDGRKFSKKITLEGRN